MSTRLAPFDRPAQGGDRMSTIVLVHGIAQEQLSADTLESAWLPALAGGVRNHGRPELADRLWRHTAPGDLTVRMAYYGHYFLDPDAQGPAGPGDLNKAEIDLAEQLATAWLSTAAATAPDARDRAEASRHVTELTDPSDDAQGPRAALRPAINGLTRLRWFAPLGIGLAGRFVWQALTQVTRYLSDDTIRAGAQNLVLHQIGPDTRLVIGHSLGSVVAYEALHRTQHPAALLTLGSPLGLRTVIYDRLLPHPPRVPSAVTRWDNLVDRDDLVAAHLDLQPYFPPAPGHTVVPITPTPIDNGSKPHDATHYLTKPSTGRIVAEALTTPPTKLIAAPLCRPGGRSACGTATAPPQSALGIPGPNTGPPTGARPRVLQPVTSSGMRRGDQAAAGGRLCQAHHQRLVASSASKASRNTRQRVVTYRAGRREPPQARSTHTTSSR
jgi:hypothetical protein